MRDTLTVAKFTASDMIKRKSFIISTIIIFFKSAHVILCDIMWLIEV